jgi:hypothetical protein
LWTSPKIPKIILVVPLLWSFMGSTAALGFGILEDVLLLVSGIVGVVLIWYKNK